MRRILPMFTLMILSVISAFAQTEFYATWSSTASNYRGSASRITYVCPANGTVAIVWGTDLYTDDSSVCTAAVHEGLITLGSGGRVTIEIRAGASSYQGTTRNGVTSNSYASWGGSYVFVGTASPGQPTTASGYIERGLKFVDNHEYVKAIADFTEAIRLEPGNGYGYLNRGLAHTRSGNTEQAMADTNRAVELLPSNPTAFANRSILYSISKNRIAAKADAEKAIALDPAYGRGYVARGLNVMAENPDAALSDFDRGIQLEPSFANGYYFRGLLRLDKKQYDPARSDFQKAIDLGSDIDDVIKLRNLADEEWKKASAPPAPLPMIDITSPPSQQTARQQVKCKSLDVHVPSKTVAPGEPAFFAATVDGKYFARADRWGYVWSTTAGKLNNTSNESTAVLDTSTIEAPTVVTVTVEIGDQSIPECRSKSFASASVRIASPVPPEGQMIASYDAPLDETANDLILNEVKRHAQLVKAAVIGDELQVRAYSGPDAPAGQNLKALNALRQYLLSNGADIAAVRFVDKGRRESAGIELWMAPKSVPKPAARRPGSRR